MLFGNLEVLHSFDTYQMTDYSNIDYTYLDSVKKKERRDTVFPLDCDKAYEMGMRLVTKQGKFNKNIFHITQINRLCFDFI